MLQEKNIMIETGTFYWLPAVVLAIVYSQLNIVNNFNYILNSWRNLIYKFIRWKDLESLLLHCKHFIKIESYYNKSEQKKL